jgi:hypothetical protein
MGLGFPSSTAFLFAELLVEGLHLEEIFQFLPSEHGVASANS